LTGSPLGSVAYRVSVREPPTYMLMLLIGLSTGG
jgi:hypothetical protein